MNGWKPWFAWYPVELQDGQWIWGRTVEYQQIRMGRSSGAFGSGPTTITHYRLPDDAPEFHTRGSNDLS